MVPEPSIISLPIPFIDVETGWGAEEYMTTNCSSFRQKAVARAVAPTVLVRESARSRLLVDDYDDAATTNFPYTVDGDGQRRAQCRMQAGRELKSRKLRPSFFFFF